jgi:hypothetical protein
LATVTLLVLGFCAIIALLAIGVGGFLLLVKLGVIVREAARPPLQDYGDYRLDQGREVRPEDDPE